MDIENTGLPETSMYSQLMNLTLLGFTVSLAIFGLVALRTGYRWCKRDTLPPSQQPSYFLLPFTSKIAVCVNAVVFVSSSALWWLEGWFFSVGY